MRARYMQVLEQEKQLSQKPEAERTHDDWRALAAIRCEAGDLCKSVAQSASGTIGNNQEMVKDYSKERLSWYSLAWNALLTIPQPHFEVDKGDWRNLARYQVKYAAMLKGVDKQNFIEAAIKTLKSAPKFTDDCKRDMGKYYYKLSQLVGVQEDAARLVHLKHAIAIYEELSKKIHLESADLRCFAKFNRMLGVMLLDNTQSEIDAYNAAITLQNKIPMSDYNHEDYFNLVAYYKHAAIFYFRNDDYRNAEFYYLSALNVFADNNYKLVVEDILEIAKIYDNLTRMVARWSSENVFFNFANNVFSGQELDAKNEFLRYLKTILNASSSQPTPLLLALKHFMQIVKNNLQNTNFRCASLKNWLKDENSFMRFNGWLEEIEIICKPLEKLLSSAEQTPSLMYAVVLQISSQRKTIEEQGKRIETLEGELKVIKGKLKEEKEQPLAAMEQPTKKSVSSPGLFRV